MCKDDERMCLKRRRIHWDEFYGVQKTHSTRLLFHESNYHNLLYTFAQLCKWLCNQKAIAPHCLLTKKKNSYDFPFILYVANRMGCSARIVHRQFRILYFVSELIHVLGFKIYTKLSKTHELHNHSLETTFWIEIVLSMSIK